MKRPLDKITIKGYKSIRELTDFELKSINVLIGANGSGKTNLISVFKLLNQIVEGNLQRFVGQSGGAAEMFYFGQKTTDKIEFRLVFGSNGYDCSFIPAAGDTLIFDEERMWYHESGYANPLIIPLGGGYKETKLVEESQKRNSITIADHVLNAMKSWKIYHFHDTSMSARVKQFADINDNETLRADASNLAAFLFLLRETELPYYRRIVNTIKLVAPFFEDFVLRPNPLNPQKIQLEWNEVGSDSYFNAHVLSDGTLRFICLAALLLQPNLPSTILIDEPELGLHPYAIQILAGLLQTASHQTQVIVSTQSISLVNEFELDDIIVVDRIEKQSTFRRLNSADFKDWIEVYGVGDLWEKNVLGGRPK